ncbi:hypothetical protein ACWCV4_37920, partial [Streptomyces yangpuensis]
AFDAELLERYFTTLDFRFGPDQLAGVREFARRPATAPPPRTHPDPRPIRSPAASSSPAGV